MGAARLHASSRVQSGVLLKPDAGTFAGVSSAAEVRLERVPLDIGGPVWVAGPTAAALHGLVPCALAEPFHVLVAHERELVRDDVVVWRSRNNDWCDLGMRDGFPVTRPARTLVDLGRDVTAAELREALDAGIETLMVNDHVLHRRLVALADEPGADALYRVVAARDAEHGVSWPGAEFRRLMECHGTRRPDVEVFADRVECRWEGSDVVAVVLGWKAGPNPARLDELRAQGPLLVFTYDQLVLAPRDVVTTTRDALRTPRFQAPTRPPGAPSRRQTGGGGHVPA